jgi:antitoxin MazE
MTTKIQKWGNSLALRIPKSYAKTINISEGTNVKLNIDENKIIISREKKQTYTLNDLLAKVSGRNIHKEIVYGKPRGKELL